MFGLFVYGHLHYKHKVRQELTITSHKMTKPVKAVLLSDLHIGYHNQRDEVHRWIDLINDEKPDMILIAGDIIDGSIRPLKEQRIYEEFQRLKAPVYACLGNHEYYSGEPGALKFYQQAGIHLLRDSVVSVGDLCIIGRDDATNMRRKPVAELSSAVDYSKFTILLDHQPHHLEKAEEAGIDFQFSGHTHRGQVWPISWITDAIYECSWGSHQRGNTRYYVSSGIGIWGGMFRIGTRSEYVVLEVRGQK
jgi:predicted MPP superfamily phosphohydrolase